MNTRSLPRAASWALLSQRKRALRLKFGEQQAHFDEVLLPQRADVRESIFGGIDGCITCVSTRAGLALQDIMGLPVSLRMLTDRGALRLINGIVADVREGESDGGLAAYQIVMRDALAILERRSNTRIFRQQSTLDVIDTLITEWRHKSAVLAGAFYLDYSKVDAKQLPWREQTIQFDESDAAFVRRLCRRDGIGWFIRAGAPRRADAGRYGETAHTLVLYDDASKLERSAIEPVAYRADGAAGERDAVTLVCTTRQLVPGSIRRFSWDYRPAETDRIESRIRVDQGNAGNDLAQLLMDSRVDAPHIADSWQDYDRIGVARAKAQGTRAVRVDCVSQVRALSVGEWIEISGYEAFDGSQQHDLRITIASVRHRAENNLPKALNECAQALFNASRWPSDPPPVSLDTPERPTIHGDSTQSRYENTFSAVPCGLPIAPAYDPSVDLPRVHPVAGIVVTTSGEEIYCDEMGRIKVQLQGLDSNDHEHAKGAGTGNTHNDSAWVRVLTGLAGAGFGENWLPRKGMEVLLDFFGGDPDKIYVAGVLHNGPNRPATFSNTGALPGNRYVSGVKTREIKGSRYNQLRFDDTPSQISAQLSSQHATSEVNLGYLTQPRTNGAGEARGEGAELRTDAAAALRAARGILLTTYGRSNAHGHQLDRDELIQLLRECMELFKSLGDYAGHHGGHAADTAGQRAVADAFAGWQCASRQSESAAAAAMAERNADALMAFGAQAGSVHVTPKTHVIYAGENIDQVAGQHVQVTSGQKISLQAGQGVALFAQSGGVSAIANQDKVVLQSQGGDTQIDSAKNIQITAAGGQLSGAASDEVVLVTSGGAYLKLHGENIELGCPGSFTVKAADHQWEGPASMGADMPKFGQSALGRVPKLLRAADGQAVAGIDADVNKASGDLLDQATDSAGKLSPLRGEQVEQLAVQFIKKTV